MATRSFVPKAYIYAAAGFYPLAIAFYLCISQVAQHPAQTNIWPDDALSNSTLAPPTHPATVSARAGASANGHQRTLAGAVAPAS